MMEIQGGRDAPGAGGRELSRYVETGSATSIEEVQERAFGLIEGYQKEINQLRDMGINSGARQLEEDLQVAKVVTRSLGLRVDRGSD